jgi:hypothetical protein
VTAPWRGRWAGGAVRSGGSGLINHMRCGHASTQHLPGRSSSSVGSRGATTAPSPALQAPPRHAMCTTYTRKYTNIYVIRFAPAPRPPPRAETPVTAARARGARASVPTVHGACLARRGSRARTRDHTETDATRGRGVASGDPRARRAAALRGTRRNTRRAAPPWRARWGAIAVADAVHPTSAPTSHVPRPTDAVGCAG